jgi:hypothetical protein
VLTFAEGSFTQKGRREKAYLLDCGAVRRLVVVFGDAIAASLDVPEDVLIAAGDIDRSGEEDLLLIGHADRQVAVRVISAAGGKLTPLYSLTAPLEPCAHTVVHYRTIDGAPQFHDEREPKRCQP